MKDLKILSEITTRYGTRNINELEFSTPEDFAAYKKKHKMRPGTVVKVAGKDKVVGDKPKDKTPVKVGDKKLKVNTKELRKDFKEKTKEYNNAYEMHTALDDDLYDYDDYDNISDKKLRDSISYDLGRLQDKLNTVSDTNAKFKDLEGVYVELETLKKQVNHILDRQPKPEVGTKVKDGKLKSSGPQQFADDVKNMKGEFDLDGGMKIKDGKMFDADGEEMDLDDIENFYYQDAFDEKGINVGIDIKKENYNPNDKYLIESVDLLKRDFGAPLPTLQSVMEKHQKNIKEGPDDVKVTKKQLQMLIKQEGDFRKRMLNIEQGFLRDPRPENKKLAKEIKKSYKDNVTKFMREVVGMLKRMK